MPGIDEKPNAIKQLTRTPSLIFSVVIAPASATAGRPAIKGRFSSDSRIFPFRFRWGVRKGGGHGGLCVVEITLARPENHS